jgi:hypothetical protein
MDGLADGMLQAQSAFPPSMVVYPKNAGAIF